MVLPRPLVLLCVGILFVAGLTGIPYTKAQSRSSTPVLVELFTSEGCSSCPPADTFLQRLIDTEPVSGVQVIGLGQHVDYWDHQGWRDRFSSAALTDRQQRYASVLHVEAIYTPQMIVDGRFQFVGSDTKAGRHAIEQALAQPRGAVEVSVQPASANRLAVAVTASALPPISRGDRADFVVAITEDGLQSNVRAGENNGRTLAHAAVVRRLMTIGDAAGQQASARTEVGLDRDWRLDHLKVVAFVQERSSRRILGSGIAALR
jgi:hypothetical protein